MIKTKILGHPVHMMMVHFPAAFFPLSFVLTAASFFLGDSELIKFDFYTISAASLFGWIALVFGAFDLWGINPNSDAFKVGLYHGSINSIVLLIYSFYTVLKMQSYPNFQPANSAELVLKGIAVLLMLAANYYGGELVLKYHIGSKSKSL